MDAPRTRAPLQNRVDPFGRLLATAARGLLMGNRGGRFHLADQTLGERRHVSRRWIACVCDFRNRRRTIWGAGYTEVFFLDEVTALSAGHRPCFECRRADATGFAQLFPLQKSATADAIDARLHEERLARGHKLLHKACLDDLPDGAMFAELGVCFAVKGDAVLRWSFGGYVSRERRPGGSVSILTPPSILETLRNGYAPLWHTSAEP